MVMKNRYSLTFLSLMTLMAFAVPTPATAFSDDDIQAQERIGSYMVAGWTGGFVLDLISYAFPKARLAYYGSTGNVPLDISSLEQSLGVVVSTKAVSRKIWSFIVGDVFCNHDSLFVSQKVADMLQKGGVNALDETSKKQLVGALLMMKSNFDQTLLKWGIAVPLAVQGSTVALDYLVKNGYFGSYTEKIAKPVKTLKESLFYKVGLVTTILALYVLVQRSLIALEVNKVMTAGI